MLHLGNSQTNERLDELKFFVAYQTFNVTIHGPIKQTGGAYYDKKAENSY